MPSRATQDVDWNNTDPAKVEYKIGIYGWRKRCVYFLILLILVIAVINLSLTIWVMRVMDFNWEGMGKLRVTDKGLKLYGDGEFMKSLYAQKIVSRPGESLHVESTANTTVNARNDSGAIVGQLFVGGDEVVAKNKRFLIKGEDGKQILYADKDKIIFDANELVFSSPNGANFSGSLETENVKSPPFKHLKLESLTRSLYMNAPKGITLNSKAGPLKMTSLDEVKIKSLKGKVTFDAEKVLFSKLKQGTPTGGAADQNARELCMCKDGSLFMAPVDSSCKVTTCP